jgi:Tol biopolymer transport system component
MRTRIHVPLLTAAVSLTAAVAFTQNGAPRPSARPAGRITFSETIAPIVYANCVTCHRPGEAAPFPLISYDDVRKRGTLIATVTESRFMPPWHAVHGYGEFVDERRLTDTEIATIREWVKQGMPQGDPARMPKLPQFTDGWHLGPPDLILQMPVSFEVPAGGPDIYRNFAIPTGLTEDRWVRAVEFRPGARKAVHHALFAYVRSGALKDFEGKDGKPGSTGLNGLGLGLGIQPAFAPAGGLGGWAVGGTPAFLPDGHALPLAKGTDLILQLHLHPTGKPEMERSTVGLYFADKAPDRKLAGIGLPTLFGIGSGIDIPAGEKNFTIQDSMTLPVDVRVFSAMAHAHYLGKEMKATATLPDGTIQPLLWIQDWDFNWQDRYAYKQPLLLPKGTRIDVRITYDNSADNPRNPSNPPRRVLWGEQSFDEMGGVGLDLITVRREDEAALAAANDAGLKAAIARGGRNGTIRRYLEAQRRARGAAGPPPRLQQITLLDRQGKAVTTVGEPGVYSQAALSPDGTRVAVIRTDPETQDTDVWVYDVATGKGTSITRDATPNAAPVWSPDGNQIAYVSVLLDDNYSTLSRTSSNGSGREELLYKHPTSAAIVLTDWSADGLLCFWSEKTTYALPLTGERNAIPLSGGEFNVRGGRFSPDGRFVAYASDESGRFQVYAKPFSAAASSAASFAAKSSPVSAGQAIGGIFWRQDGMEMFFLNSPQQAVMAVDVATSPEFKSGTPRLLFPLPSPMLAPAQLSSISSRDGQRFVFLTQMPTQTSAITTTQK